MFLTSLFSLFTSFLAWFHFLCLLVLPVDLAGWQSRPVQPGRWLKTEQPSFPRWTQTNKKTQEYTDVDKQEQRHADTHNDSDTAKHEAQIYYVQRETTQSTRIITVHLNQTCVLLGDFRKTILI